MTRPSAKTAAVWVAVTVRPRIRACRGVPRDPTRYPATIALPWPGERACRAPQPNAAASRKQDQEAVGVAAREGVGEPVERPILAALAAGRAPAGP